MIHKIIKYIILYSIIISNIPYIEYSYSNNKGLRPRKEVSSFWAVTNIFQDTANIIDGFCGRDRYNKTWEYRVDWLDDKWISENRP